MLFDFLQQLLFAGFFFLGMAGVGYLILRSLGYNRENPFLDLSLAYFTSLCLYTIFIVAGLFIAPDKRGDLLISTLVYGAASLYVIAYRVKREADTVREFLLQHRAFAASFLLTLSLAVFLFFLQIYHTAILDEWLHRPVVQSFVDNGVFPLVNPLNPASNYIQTYHYGTQVIAAALQLVFRLDVSASLDLLKLSYFIATFFLFYGLIFLWTKKRYLSLVGAVLVLFSGSSFFFLDSFTVSHLVSFKGWGLAEGERWPINAALNYILTGITWVNIPLVIAFGVLFEQVSLGLIQRLRLIPILLVSVLFSGFYLISELFFVVLCAALLPYLVSVGYRQRQLLRTCVVISVVSILLFFGIYFSGGIIGNMLRAKGACIIHRCPALVQSSQSSSSTAAVIEKSVDLQKLAPSFITLRPFSLWGYPSEKKILVIWDRPWYYLRTLLLEIVVILLIAYAAYNKISIRRDHPVLFLTMAIGLIGPFFFSTMFGNLNFFKTTTASLVLLHLFMFYLIARLPLQRWFAGILIVFLAFGSVSGLLMGPNIQWHIISGKGKDQYCSQNPLCYKGPLAELLRRFEAEKPGLKRIGAAPKDVNKVIDLTQSYVYGVNDPRIAYIVETPELRASGFSGEISGQLLYEAGEYRIWQVN
jgi:hypothetical protein